MHKLGITAIMVLALGFTSCNKRSADERMEDANSNQDASDTVAHVGNGEIASDSTLHPIETITLKATGNKLDEIAFSEDTIKVPAGALVKIEFINEGSELPMIHNFVVSEAGTYKAVALEGERAGVSGNYLPANRKLMAASPLALPGQTVQVEFETPLKPGIYDFVCTYPGHWKRMHGTLIVE